jgi:hypothetical protein
MKTPVGHPLRALAVATVLSLAVQGCVDTSSGRTAAPAAAVNPHDEAARLIRSLELSGHLQDAARDYVAVQIARGIPARAALVRWIEEQRDRGAVIRCKPQVSATDECIART